MKRVNKKNEISHTNGNIKAAVNLSRNTKRTNMIDKNKKDPDKATFNTHSNSGVIGSKQLQSIYNLVGDVRQRMPGDGKENQQVVPWFDAGDHPQTKTDEEVISSVMQQIAEMNRDKLSDESMIKVLTAVYLDAKAKIAEKSKSDPQLLTDSSSEKPVQHSEGTVSGSQSEKVVSGEVTNADDKFVNPGQSLSIAERKRIQWKKEKAELQAIEAKSPWNKYTLKRPTTESAIVPSQTGPPLINSFSCSYSNPETLSSKVPPALTPMAFAAHEEAERTRREEQRKLWKAGLDQQLLEQRLFQEKIRLEEQRRTEALLKQMNSQQANVSQSLTPLESSVRNPGLSTIEVKPILGPVTAHPSASHFISTACLPTTLVPPHSMYDVSMTSTPAQNVSVSGMLPNASFQGDSTVVVGSGANTMQSVSRTNFNRTRGFTQQIYVDSVETAERARLAHEARMENLRQIEEKQRRKEADKARRLLEEKLDEERIARERAELKAIAEAEHKERLRRKELERHQVEQLHANLIQARQEVERDKALRHGRQPHVIPTPTGGGDHIQSSFDAASTSIEATQVVPASVPCMRPQQAQSILPSDLPMFTTTSVAAVPMMPAVPMTQPFTNLLYLPQQVPVISSSYVQTTSKEDAEVQTESRKAGDVKKNLIPRSSRETEPGRVNNQINSVQPNNTKSDHLPPRSNNTTDSQTTATAMAAKTSQHTAIKRSSILNTNISQTNKISPKNTDCNNRRRQINGQASESSSTALGNGDVVDADYNQTAYTAEDPNSGFIPCHRPQSRQRKHTGFTPPPALLEPPVKPKPNGADSKGNSARMSASVPRPIPTRIPVPTQKLSTVPRPTRLNPTSETPIRIQRAPSYPDGSLDRVGYDSLDVVRTHDVLNPLDANNSLPISREASARVRAREAHKKFSNPALYGDPPISSSKTKRSSMTDKKRTPSKTSQSDPILNPELVKERPTPRQDSILRHLSQIRQELKMKQALYESGNYDEDD